MNKIVSKVKAVLKEKNGISTVETAVIFLVIMIVFSVVLEYANIQTILKTTQADAQRVLDSMVIKNASEIFSSIRIGTSATTAEQNEYLESIGLNGKYYMRELQKEMGLRSQGGKYYRGDSRNSVFIIPTGSGEFVVEQLSEERLEIHMDFRVGRTVNIIGDIGISYSVPFSISSHYTKKNAVSTGEELVTQPVTTPKNLLEHRGEDVRKEEPTTKRQYDRPTQPAVQESVVIN